MPLAIKACADALGAELNLSLCTTAVKGELTSPLEKVGQNRRGTGADRHSHSIVAGGLPETS